MKIASWNVNGIRSVWGKGFSNWLNEERPEVVCLQEVKASAFQLEERLLHPLKMHSFFHEAQKKGYSGVAFYSKKEPLGIRSGIGVEEIDREGRVISAEFEDFVLVNAYFPNSQRDHARLGFKLHFCDRLFEYLQSLGAKGKNVVLCGDTNIAHEDIDLRNPKQNRNNAGFLPEERAWMTRLLSSGYVDGFRYFSKEPGHYTWWSYRPTIRERNIGWRLDYFIANQAYSDRLKSVVHRTQILGSDHCPVVLTLKR